MKNDQSKSLLRQKICNAWSSSSWWYNDFIADRILFEAIKLQLRGNFLVDATQARALPKTESIWVSPAWVLDEKFDHFQIWANKTQHLATCHNTWLAKRAKHVAPNNVAICCVQMLRSFGRGLKMVKYSCIICGCCVMLFSFGSCHNLALGNSSICKTQHVVTGWPTCCAQQCCDMLRWNVTIVWPVLYTPLFPVKILHACQTR